jgi:hypothetical protein
MRTRGTPSSVAVVAVPSPALQRVSPGAAANTEIKKYETACDALVRGAKGTGS